MQMTNRSSMAMTRRAVLAATAFAPVAARAAARPTDEVARALNTHVDTLAADMDFSGSVLLWRGSKTLLRRAWGPAERNFGASNSPDTRFNVASVGKMFTAVAVMRLVETGRLALGDSVAMHLPDYPNVEVSRQVTVGHLLSHSSGLGSAPEKFAARPNGGLATLADYLDVFGGETLQQRPGSGFLYSNPGYIILALILEKLTGEDFYAHVGRTIFAPLGMTGTGYPRLDTAGPGIATGYTRALEQPGAWQNNLFVSAVRGGPHGGAFSTVDDLARFGEALLGGRLVSRGTLAQMATPRFAYHRGHYGYGLSIETIGGQRVIGHSGGHPGVAADMRLLPNSGYGFVLLSNSDVDAFFDLDIFVRRLLTGDDQTARNYAFTVDLAHLVVAEGVEAGLRRYAARPSALRAREGVLDTTALRHLHRGENSAARALLGFTVRAFPASSWAKWSLAEALRVMGDKPAALAAYLAYQAAEPSDADVPKRIALLKARN
jgi:D-alanyl-D-alanine carboxypeptidase